MQQGVAQRWSRYASKLALSLLLGGGVAWLLVRGGLPLVPPASSFDRVRPWALAAFAACTVAQHVVKATRWRHLLRPLGDVPPRVLLAVAWVSFAAILLAPLRAGEIVRPVLLARRTSISAWSAAGTTGAERILDGLALSGTLFVALQLAPTLSPLPREIAGLPLPLDAVPAAAYGTLALFVAAFCVMALFFWRRELARRATRAVVGLASRRAADALADVVERVASGLRFLPSAGHMAPFLIETGVFWALNVASVWLAGFGVGLDGFTPSQAAVALGCIGIGVLVPSGPGFFGVFQLSSYVALAMFFPEPVVTGPGAAFVFVLYVGQIGVHLACALAGVLLDPHTRIADAGRIAGEGAPP